MANTRRLTKAVSKIESLKQTKFHEIPGLLGVLRLGQRQVDVDGRPGFVWVRLRGIESELIQAYNDLVAPVYDLPVLVIRDDVDSSRRTRRL